MVDKGWTETVEVAESLGYLTEDVDLVWKGEFFLLVSLEVVPQTGVHLLQNQHGNKSESHSSNGDPKPEQFVDG